MASLLYLSFAPLLAGASTMTLEEIAIANEADLKCLAVLTLERSRSEPGSKRFDSMTLNMAYYTGRIEGRGQPFDLSVRLPALLDQPEDFVSETPRCAREIAAWGERMMAVGKVVAPKLQAKLPD